MKNTFDMIFQSTLLQEERQLQHGAEHLRITISIHAPTRGATSYDCQIPIDVEISIHAPTRGATNPIMKNTFDMIFQSTLLQEERRWRNYLKAERLNISIHAPTRGATAKMHNIPYASLQ